MDAEFSLGERLARLEALVGDMQPQMDRRFMEDRQLVAEKLDGLRREIEAKAEAQKSAVDKAEQASDLRFNTFIEQNDRKSEVTQNRLAAIERITSEDTGATRGVESLKASTVAWISALAALLLVLLTALAGHLFG